VIRDRFPTTVLPVWAEGQTTASASQSDTLTEADRFERSYEPKSVKSDMIKPSDVQPKLSVEPEKIITWHWHDPLDKPKGFQASTKRKSGKAIAPHPRIAD
jgi:hypothetical protein